MNTVRDIIAAALVIFGGVVVYAKLQSYDWWLLGSWKGALAVVAVTGVLIALTNITELMKDDGASVFESLIWFITGLVVVANLIVTTTKAQFIASSALIGFAWLVQQTRHIWESTHQTPDRYISAH